MMMGMKNRSSPLMYCIKPANWALMGVLVPHEYGGASLGYHEYMHVIMEIAAVCGSVGLSVAAHNSLYWSYAAVRNEEQKRNTCPNWPLQEWIGAWGSPNLIQDLMPAICNVATRDGNDWIINGTKSWITHGNSGNVAVVIARTGEPRTSRNCTAFIVERGTPGFSAGKRKISWACVLPETAEMIFDNCRIADSQRLGEVGDGFVQAMKVLDGGRISIAALSLGIAKGAYKAALQYAKRETI